MTTRVMGGATTTYVYDGLNRLVSVTYPGSTPAVSQVYTKTNKLKSVSSTAATHTYNYDDNDNLVNELLTVDTYPFLTTYGYNGNDQLTSLTYPRSGRSVDLAPDLLGRPSKVGTYVSAVAYWPSGQVQSMSYANGTRSSYAQNSRLWPSTMSLTKGSVSYLNTSYAYDGKGNLKSISDSVDGSLNRVMGYDGVDRLTSVSGPWGSGGIVYDGAGNITQQVFGSNATYYRYDTSNRLSGISGNQNVSLTYDGYGDIATARGNAYTYDGVPNLRCINCSGAAKVEYAYDGTNQRIWVSKAGVKTYEVYNNQGNLLVEYTPSTNKLIEYMYLAGKRVAQRVSP
ncbi:hypothetical protein [Pseudoduganella armeniaca]|uniref:hypothetical protein n=1 Tax=Pseudoduganella armeniaca TaxID=2072590 RepID=UPI001C626D63|nr:hypothetical protein [Pseudoduganella armeniaca]